MLFSTQLKTGIPTLNRSIQQRFSIKKYVLKNFATFTEKHLCQSLFFDIKFQSLFFDIKFFDIKFQPATLLKRDPGSDLFQ